MTRRIRQRIACLAVGVVATAGMTGAFATTAVASEAESAPTSGAAFDAYAQTLLTTDEVQAVATDAAGNVVLYTTAPVDQIADERARSLAQTPDNVVVKPIDAPFTAYAENEVVGGAGYFAVADPEAPSGSSCSVGFTGWDADGDPAIISAGHCTDDGGRPYSYLTLPSAEPAGGGDPTRGVVPIAPLASLSFSQYGGPGNSAGAEGDVTSVDISVWDLANSALDLLPEVTDWTTAASEDLAASTIPVRSVGQATVGAAVSKSGRTTGFTSGTVEAVNGWANVSGRQVYGFMNVLTSSEGDSGGAVIQGDRAVGILSGGTTSGGVDYTFAADLQASLAMTDGYTVALYLDTPVLTGPADGGDVFTGAPITGTGPAGATLEVTPEAGEPFEVPIGADGRWSFAAPGEVGTASYSVVATRGFDSSDATSFSVEVLLAPLAAPVFTSPANGAVVETELTEISGTGEPGATVTLTGTVEDVVEVDDAGAWSVDVDLSYGQYSVTAVQARADAAADETSPAATSSFAVAPVAPAITGPANGATFTEGSGPTAVTGTGIDGAVVNVAVGGTAVGNATVANGVWTVSLSSQLAAGTAAITATQTINGATGAAATSSITIAAAASPAGTGGSALASTGVSPVLPVAVALLVLLLGAGAFVIGRRRAVSQRG